MRKSARYLGYDIGLNAQEMNQLLKDQGFLSGIPGNYDVTEKGKLFAEETYNHRGTGGYSHYNRGWTTRTWEESVLDEMDLSSEAKEKAKEAVRAHRKKRDDEKVIESITNTLKDPSDSSSNSISKIVIVVICAIFIIPLIIYLICEYFIPWIREKLSHEDEEEGIPDDNENEALYMRCPSCNSVFLQYPIAKVWICNDCSFRMTEDEVLNSEFWYCDNCSAFLNSQAGFDRTKKYVTCSVCGCQTSIQDDEPISE